MHQIQLLNCRSYLCGDYNIDLLKINDKNSYNDFFENITSNGYTPSITMPTRISGHSYTIIDNIYTNNPINTNETLSFILTNQISDHQPIITCIDINTKINTPKTITVTVRGINAMIKFKNDLTHSNLIEKLDKNLSSDPNANYDLVANTLQILKEKHFPTKVIKFDKRKHKKSNWITNGILKSIAYKNKLYKQLLKTPRNTAEYNARKTNLKTYQKILKKSIISAKKQYYFEKFNTNKDNIKNTWQTIKDILNTNKKNKEIPPYFKLDDRRLTDPAEIANNFNKYFANIGINYAKSIKPPKNKTFKTYLLNPCKHTFEFNLLNNESTSELINALKPKDSAGYDNISTKLLKFIKDVITPTITLIINQSITTGIFPDKLKISKIIPIYKKNEDCLFSNYRPISLLPAISKLFEMAIYKQLNIYLDHFKLLYKSQYGFREDHSTELANLELIDHVTNYMDDGKSPFNIYIDFSKAFDTINHNILLSKLSHYGITGTANKLMANYLHNRKQFVNYNDTESDMLDITAGVPQGSILGPLLFIIYINDITFSSKLFTFINYADDTTLISTTDRFAPFSSINELEFKISNELNLISDWVKVNQLAINPDKTKFMIFHKPQKKVNYFSLTLEGKSIERVDSFNSLGLIINKQLTWKTHTENISKKIATATGIINKIKLIIPKNILITLYNTLILPHLNYCILAWGHKPGRLITMQKKIIRIISFSNYNAHTEPLFKIFSILKLDDMYKHNILKFYYKLINRRIPVFFYNFTPFSAISQHKHNTRFKDHNLPTVKHEFAKNNLRYQLICQLNLQPKIITSKVHTHSLAGFTKYSKYYLLNCYDILCHIDNCYVCNLI